MSEKEILWTTNIGSHMWKMERPDSDEDLSHVYLADTVEIFKGKQFRGTVRVGEKEDVVYFELGKVVSELLKGNVNLLWTVMSPLIKFEHKNALRELRQITEENLSKNYYHSIHGLAKHNIYHFILHPDKLTDQMYHKKLNTIGRTIKFGINLLLYKKCLFEKVDIQKKEELDNMVMQLNDAYKASDLVDTPSEAAFIKYLVKWRLYKVKKDYP